MRTMFVKLFLWFWLAMTLSGIVFFVLAVNIQSGPLAEHRRRIMEERQRVFGQALSFYGRVAVIAYERDGAQALTGELGDQVVPAGMRAYLIDGYGRPLSGPDIPAPVREAASRVLKSGIKETVADERMLALALPVAGSHGQQYVAAAGMPPLPPRGLPRGFPFRGDFGIRLAISFVVGGIVCYGLAWRLTAPVRRLRTVAQSLAAGDLSARVGADKWGKGDEIADLGRDFDRMAERIENLVTVQKRLVRDISHELRSPLARLNVALGLTRQQASPAAEGSLNRIEREAERLNEMIGELLTLSLLESGGERVLKEKVDLLPLVEEVVHDAHYEAESLGRSVCMVSSEELVVEGNGELLRRALENVVRNAVRYTGEGTAVEIAVGRGEKGTALIRVRDHGPGVPEEFFPDIFRPFCRVADARDRQSGGTGIGLAITERAVRFHGGTVTACNAPDGGLVVEIELPACW